MILNSSKSDPDFCRDRVSRRSRTGARAVMVFPFEFPGAPKRISPKIGIDFRRALMRHGTKKCYSVFLKPQKNAAVVEGEPRRPLLKHCGNPERGMRLPQVRVRRGTGLFPDSAKILSIGIMWKVKRGNSRARRLHLRNKRVMRDVSGDKRVRPLFGERKRQFSPFRSL